VILLNKNNRVLGLAHVSQGGVTGTVLDPRVIFCLALKANATGLVIAHNHPSGNLKPSNEDINITKQLVSGGKLLGIDVADHLIITADGYYSLADNGLM